MSKRVTIYDIAEATGVSTSTVSRALGGSALIGQEVVHQVQQAAERLGYRQRRIRRQAERTILTIKLVLPHLDQPYLHQFYDVVTLAEEIRAGAAPTRVHLVIETTGKDLDLFPHKKGGDVDGVIFAFTRPSASIYAECRQRGVPCLTLNRVIGDGDYVTADNRGGAAELVRRAHAVRPDLRPCFLRPAGLPDVVRERSKGIKGACRQEAVPFGSEDVITVADPQAVDEELLTLLQCRGYNAVFAFNDLMAIRVVQVAQAQGVSIPADLMVLGYDDAPVRSLIQPAIASMTMPVADIARSAGEWIGSAIVNRDQEPWQRHLPGVFCPGETMLETTS